MSATERLAPGARRLVGIGLAVAILGILALLLIPLPPFLLDLALAASLTIGFVVLLITLYTERPLDFSTFPSLLLALTMFRLSLNVASMKLILSQGYAGRVISAFGDYVIRGSVVLGIIMFLILTVINFVVITKGAGRIAEVAARFNLDAMPGRQMAIDADLAAGMIDELEAKKRREDIQRQSEFYGSMDGASKFVRGDAIAGLLIIAINLIAGIIIGVVQRNLDFTQALKTYSSLSIGDGIVSQIPALVISLASGFIVTATASDGQLGEALALQLTKHRRALWITAGVVAVLGFAPGIPAWPFWTLAVATAVVAAYGFGATEMVEEADSGTGGAPAGEMVPADSPEQQLLHIEPLQLELGITAVEMARKETGGTLASRITAARMEVGADLGMLIPTVRIKDNPNLGPNEYVIRLRGVEVAGGQVLYGCVLALDAGDVIEPVKGIPTKDPTYGLPAVWVQRNQRIEAEASGYTVIDPETVLAQHLMETIRIHAADLLGREEVQHMVDVLQQSHPVLVKDVVPNRVTPGTLQRVLQRLLREGIPIRDLVTVLETLSDASDSQIRDPDMLAEQVRRALGKHIARLLQSGDGTIRAIMLGTQLEAALLRFFSPAGATHGGVVLDPEMLRKLLDTLERTSKRFRQDGRLPPLITPPALRLEVRRLVEPLLPTLPVVSLAELPANVPIHVLANWELPGQPAKPRAASPAAPVA